MCVGGGGVRGRLEVFRKFIKNGPRNRLQAGYAHECISEDLLSILAISTINKQKVLTFLFTTSIALKNNFPSRFSGTLGERQTSEEEFQSVQFGF